MTEHRDEQGGSERTAGHAGNRRSTGSAGNGRSSRSGGDSGNGLDAHRERRDALTDVPGLCVGHAELIGGGRLTGTTVVLAPPGGAVAAVDVRGGGPGTKETDALDPRSLVQRINAVVLTGGSAYGLDAASGVMAWLEEQGWGVRVGSRPSQVVPLVPAACVYDLGRGGDFRARPDAATGRAAAEAAAALGPGAPVRTGNVGAGTGAVVGVLKGGVGTASTVLGCGITVAALVVVNAVGSAVDPLTGALYGEFFAGRVQYPAAEVHEAAQRRLAQAAAERGPQPLNTTLAVVATDADLTRAQAQKLAGTAHDGMARAVRPVHLLHDGDTVFALATGERPLGARSESGPQDTTTVHGAHEAHKTHEPHGGHGLHEAEEPHEAHGVGITLDERIMTTMNEILAAGADQVTRAIVGAVRAAESVSGPGGTFLSYREAYGAL